MKINLNPSPSPYPTTALLFAICLCGKLSTADGHAAPGGSGSNPSQSATARPDQLGRKPIDKEGLLAQRRAEQIEKSREEGKISALEGEFMGLLSGKFETPQARQEAIRVWRFEKGAALDAEREQKRVQAKPQREAQLAKMREVRSEQIDESKKSGRIGAVEAELMTLMNSQQGNPQARQGAIRAWHETKGAALAAEREEKEATLRPIRKAQDEAIRSRRSQQISDAVASGRIGSLEGQLQTLVNGDYPTPGDRQKALRGWLEENRTALETERATRRSVKQ